MQDHGQGRLRVYVHLVALTATGCPAVTDGLDGDLARLQQWPRREDGPFALRGRLWVVVLSRCGELAGVRASAAAAVRCCGKASGRRVVRRVPRGRVAPASRCVRRLFCRVACAVPRRQARGALRAPLKT